MPSSGATGEALIAIDADWFLCLESELRPPPSDEREDQPARDFPILDVAECRPFPNSVTTATSRRNNPVIPNARLTSGSEPLLRSKVEQSTPLRTRRQVYLPELAHVMDPSHFICKLLLKQQQRAAEEGIAPSWQHSLLYRPRGYVTVEMTECQSLRKMIDVSGYRTYIFYRKMLQSFLDNWTAPRALVHSNATDFRRSRPPQRPSMNSTFPISPAPQSPAPPPVIPCVAASRSCSALEVQRPMLGENDEREFSAPGVCFYVPPFFLFATRATPSDLDDLQKMLPADRRLQDYVGRVTLDLVESRGPEEWLLNIADDLRTHKTLPLPTSFFLGLPWKQWCRVVIRCTSQNSSLYGNQSLQQALYRAAHAGDALAIASEEFKPVYIGLHFPLSLASTQPPQVPSLPLPLRQVLPNAKPTPILMEAHMKARSVVWLVGGKDMLALDWLPYISRSLHYSISRRALDHLDSGDASPSQLRPGERSAVRCINHPVYLMYEYPGYGFSSRGQSPEECTAAACESLDALLKVQDVSTDIELTVIGYSLGCGVALSTLVEILKSRINVSEHYKRLSHLRLRTLVLLAPLTTVSACAAHMLKVPTLVQPLAVKLFETFQSASMAWDNLATIKNVCDLVVQGLPHRLDPPRLYVLHGKKDAMVSSHMGQQVYEAAIAAYTKALEVLQLNSVQNSFTTAKIRATQSALAHTSFELIPDATHLSIVGSPTHQSRIHELCYDARQISIIRSE